MNNNVSKTLKRATVGMLSVALLAVCSSSTANEPTKTVDLSKMEQTGSLTFEGKAYNLIAGGTWGNGVLTFKGKKYNFKAKSIGVGYSVGVKEVKSTAKVYNLKNVNDFAGTYWGVKAAGTILVGASAANAENSKGVVLSIKGTSAGAAVDVAAGLARFVIELDH